MFWREEDMYVAKEVVTGVTSQGRTLEEAIGNLGRPWSYIWRRFRRLLRG